MEHVEELTIQVRLTRQQLRRMPHDAAQDDRRRVIAHLVALQDQLKAAKALQAKQQRAHDAKEGEHAAATAT